MCVKNRRVINIFDAKSMYTLALLINSYLAFSLHAHCLVERNAAVVVDSLAGRSIGDEIFELRKVLLVDWLAVELALGVLLDVRSPGVLNSAESLIVEGTALLLSQICFAVAFL
jgi:hypothetical protein